MTDLRITLPEGFLNEEVRSGYTVSEEIKGLWAVQLDLLNKLDEVCKEYDIEYFVMFGTLLGAVRHKGFIPWDDDIDVVCTRDNFEKLCKVAKEAFTEPYFFQTEYTDKGSHTFYAKLRNSNTAAILKPEVESQYKYNQGIFIDIFIIDEAPSDETELQNHLAVLKKEMYNSIRFARLFDAHRVYSRHKVVELMKPLIYVMRFFVKALNIPNFPLKKFDRLAAKYRGRSDAGYYGHFGIAEKYVYPKEWFDEKVYLDFEMLKVPCPKEYEKILESRYGNWKEFVIGTQEHIMSVIDTDKSYREYI
ncbi:MAG: LicD family protein [Clostridia bacterium]|nr:LicD family protein [Clostridia bacterium]